VTRLAGRLARTRQLLSECEVVPEELVRCMGRLKEFMEPFSSHFGRREMREHGEDFVRGLLSDLDRKSVEPIAERTGKDRRGMQRFIGQGGWDHRPVTEELCRQVGREIGSTEGILILDPTTFLKKGDDSVGVSHQYSGRTGQVENCQLGVFLGYVSPLGRTLVDMRLFIPEKWVKDRGRLADCHAPRKLRYRTTSELGLEMVLERGQLLPHSWVVGDAEFGHGAELRVDLHHARERYVLEIAYHTIVCDAEQARIEKHASHLSWTQVRNWKDSVPQEQWTRLVVRGGSKGPVVYYATRRRVRARWRHRVSPVEEWLLVTRTEDAEPEYRYYLSNGGPEATLDEMVQAACARFWIEDCFERAKGEVGLADYETRSWDGWHHHVTLCLLALWFLVKEQRRLKLSTPAITLQQSKDAIAQLLRNPDMDARTLAERISQRLRRNELSRISHWSKSRLLPPLYSAEGTEEVGQ
jgi:SRSO17 transposase